MPDRHGVYLPARAVDDERSLGDFLTVPRGGHDAVNRYVDGNEVEDGVFIGVQGTEEARRDAHLQPDAAVPVVEPARVGFFPGGADD